MNNSFKNGLIEKVVLKPDLEKSVDVFQSYRIKRNSRQGEHPRHRDLKEHGRLEDGKGDWSPGHRYRKGDESLRQGQ